MLRARAAVFLVLAALLAPPAFAPSAIAQPMPTQTPERGWTFTLTPYFWAAGMNGTVTTPFQRFPQRDVSADFDTILSDLRGFVLMASGEARKDRLSLVGDIVTLGVSADFSTPKQFVFPGGSGDVDVTFATLSAMFRVLESMQGVIDLGAGMRAWWASTGLALNSGLLPGRSVGTSATWADPIVSARGLLRLGEQVSLSAYGDVGGFGVGSDITWQAIGTLDWYPAPWVALRAGWRYMVVDSKTHDFGLDVSMSGPIVGATFRFGDMPAHPQAHARPELARLRRSERPSPRQAGRGALPSFHAARRGAAPPRADDRRR